MRRKSPFLLFLIIGIYLIVVLTRDLIRILGSQGRVEEAEARVEELKVGQGELQQELELVESDGFVEKQARDKLLLGREGEVVVLLPEQQSAISNQQSVDEEEPEEERANWQKWIQLFFY